MPFRNALCTALFLAACNSSPSTTAPTFAAGSGATPAAPPASGAGAPAAAGTSGIPSAAGTGVPTAGKPAPAGTGGTGAAGSAGTSTPGAAGSAGSSISGTAGAAGSPTAGAAGSAGMPTAGAAGTPSAAVSCDTALFCDGFENSGTMPDAARWQVVTPDCMGDASVELDSMNPHAGMHSVRVRASGGYCNHLFLQAKPSAALPDPLFVRFYVRFDKALTQSHVTFLAMEDASDKKNLRMGGQSEILMWNRESDDATLPELSPSGIALSQKPTPQKWSCVEFEVNGQTESLHTWVDGQPVAGLQVDGEGTPDIDAQWRRMANWTPKPTNLKLGWESYGSDANTLWFDDVALASSRIGCGP